MDFHSNLTTSDHREFTVFCKYTFHGVFQCQRWSILYWSLSSRLIFVVLYDEYIRASVWDIDVKGLTYDRQFRSAHRNVILSRGPQHLFLKHFKGNFYSSQEHFFLDNFTGSCYCLEAPNEKLPRRSDTCHESWHAL